MKLTTHLHIVPRLRIHGDVPLLSQHVMAWYLVKDRDNFIFYLSFLFYLLSKYSIVAKHTWLVFRGYSWLESWSGN